MACGGWQTIRWLPARTRTSGAVGCDRSDRGVVHSDDSDRPEHYLCDGKRLTATLGNLGNIRRRRQSQPRCTAQRIHAAKERERRHRTRTITVLSVLLVLALIAAGIAVWQRQSATSAQHIVIARGMVA
jgi:hypothetical protein